MNLFERLARTVDGPRVDLDVREGFGAELVDADRDGGWLRSSIVLDVESVNEGVEDARSGESSGWAANSVEGE